MRASRLRRARRFPSTRAGQALRGSSEFHAWDDPPRQRRCSDGIAIVIAFDRVIAADVVGLIKNVDAYVLLCALRRIVLAFTQFAESTCGTIRPKLLKFGAWGRINVRRIKIAIASACPWQ